MPPTLPADPALEMLVDARAILGEGPAWDATAGLLYWVDIIGAKVHVYDPRTGLDRTWDTGVYVGTVAPRTAGGLILALKTGIAHLDLASGAITPIGDPEADKPTNRFNDGKCDPSGRFWAGTSEWEEAEPLGALYRMDADRSIHKMVDGITVSNGMTWSLDRRTMYYIDSPTKEVWAYDYDDATGALGTRRTVVRMGRDGGYPDGMTIDSEGMLWIAEWCAWCVRRWDPATGRCLRTIGVPAAHTSACCFGGPDLQDLYITSARFRISDAELARTQPTAGGLFRIRVDVPGTPTFGFAG